MGERESKPYDVAVGAREVSDQLNVQARVNDFLRSKAPNPNNAEDAVRKTLAKTQTSEMDYRVATRVCREAMAALLSTRPMSDTLLAATTELYQRLHGPLTGIDKTLLRLLTSEYDSVLAKQELDASRP